MKKKTNNDVFEHVKLKRDFFFFKFRILTYVDMIKIVKNIFEG